MIRMQVTSADPNKDQAPQEILTFTSYVFDRNILTPASAFRFTAPGVEKERRLAIRSGDTVRLFVDNDNGKTAMVGVGIIDETDTHVTGRTVEYVITGRDTVGQLIDNDTVDANNNIIFFQQISIDAFVDQLLKGTRLVQSHLSKQINKKVTFAAATNSGETKLNALQRMLDWCNGLVWANNNGELIVDKPDFTQPVKGTFTVSEAYSNVIECRVRRNVNQAIRQIVTTLQGTDASPGLVKAETLKNMDKSLKPYKGTTVGRSVSRTFSYAGGADVINQGQGVGNGSYAPHTLSREYSAREVARENMRILDIEIVVEGHFNANGLLYDIDQVYQVDIEDEDVSEPMFVYNVSYELTMDHGMITRMRLCRLWTICAYADQLPRVVAT